MDLNEAIYQRRAIRRYSRREVTRAAVQQLIDAAIQAPSVLNEQPWAFLVIHDRQRLAAYSERAKVHLLHTYPTRMELHLRTEELYARPEYDIFHGAGTAIVIYAKPGREVPAEDCCLAAQNLMLAAHGMGLGTCPVGFARDWFNQPEVKRELGVPEIYTAVFPLVVGYPEGEPPPVSRREPEIAGWIWTDEPAATPPQAAGRG